MEWEYRHLKKISKNVVPFNVRRKIKKVSNKKERLDLYKYSVKSFLEFELKEIEKFLIENKGEEDLFHISAKANLLKLKIKYYYITYHKDDFYVVQKLLNDIKREVKDFKN